MLKATDNDGDSNDGSNAEDRRGHSRLSEAELEKVAQRAADLVWESFTLQVGKTTIRLVLYICGAMVIAALAWLGLKGEVKIP